MGTTTYTITCLSPVHVGTGTQFGKFEGVYDDKRWHLIDLDRVLASSVDANQLARAMNDRNFSWVEWLRERSLDPSDVHAYELPCPQDPEDSSIRQTIKDAHQQPYLPGTSVKGAVRTAVLWQLMSSDTHQQRFAAQYLALCVKASDLFEEIRRQRAFELADVHRGILAQSLAVNDGEAVALQQTLYRVLNIREDRLSEQQEWRNFQKGLERLGRSREWLGQPVERAILGRNPNQDLLRALLVSDSRTANIEQLAIGLVWTYTIRGDGLIEKREQGGEYKVFAEWLKPETLVTLDIRLDEFLFTEQANRELGFSSGKETAVRQLAQTCNGYAQEIIQSEKKFYDKYGLARVRDFYVDLEKDLNDLPDGGILLNIGWGGGWEIKTFGDLMRMALGEEGFRQLRQRYGLGKNPKTHQMNLSLPEIISFGQNLGLRFRVFK